MSAKEYQSCTWREFLLRFEGYQIKRSHDFENTRAIWYIILKTNWNSEKQGSCPEIHKAWPLPTDEIESIDVNSEYERLLKIMQEAEKNKLYN